MVSSILKSIRFALVLEATQQLYMRRKINNFIHNEDFFNRSPHCAYGSSLIWFSEGDNELVCGHLLMLIVPGNIFLKTCYNT